MDDLTVNFRGARKARVRPADVPSSSTLPALSTSATPTPAPPNSSTQDSQHFESMLQSLYKGHILLMQSLQVVAPPGSILTVEQFLEKVSWPGTLPSLEREGGGPSAQVPQQVQDASFEATILEPFIFEAGETQVRQEDATPERSPQISPDPPSLVVDQSSLQQPADPPTPMHKMSANTSTPMHKMSADTSTPLLDLPKDPSTPVLGLTTIPPATLVLHLTDEEGTQDKDTQSQDLSQEF